MGPNTSESLEKVAKTSKNLANKFRSTFFAAQCEEEVVIELWDEDQFDDDDLLARVRFNVADTSTRRCVDSTRR